MGSLWDKKRATCCGSLQIAVRCEVCNRLLGVDPTNHFDKLILEIDDLATRLLIHANSEFAAAIEDAKNSAEDPPYMLIQAAAGKFVRIPTAEHDATPDEKRGFRNSLSLSKTTGMNARLEMVESHTHWLREGVMARIWDIKVNPISIMPGTDEVIANEVSAAAQFHPLSLIE